MTPLELLQKVLETTESDSKKLFTYFVVLISAMFLSVVVNMIIQLVVNYRVLKNDIKKMKYERKLKYIETVYSWLYSVSNLLISIGTSDINKRVSQIRSHISNSQILLGKTFYTIANEILDYYVLVLSDPRRRNINTENKLFLQYIKEYEKL